jgi:DNA-binding CsgD family transcriptional regulator
VTTAPLTAAEPRVLSTPATVDAALAGATHQVCVARAGWGRPAGPLGRADHDNLRRGIRYRILLPDAVRCSPAVVLRAGRLSALGAEIRTVAGVPAEVTVIDAAGALLPRDRRTGEVAMVTLTGVVDAVVALFDGLWAGATPLRGADELGRRDQELLALLSAGCTDESAAARLGVSVRTVRRMMSAIMAQLGARSRFQAGLRAADRGLLTPIR